ncbi:hypothetical protein Bca4012_093038 [Brassica carinata]
MSSWLRYMLSKGGKSSVSVSRSIPVRNGHFWYTIVISVKPLRNLTKVSLCLSLSLSLFELVSALGQSEAGKTFVLKVFPFKFQTFLQLFELEDEYIQREIRKPPKKTTCNLISCALLPV